MQNHLWNRVVNSFSQTVFFQSAITKLLGKMYAFSKNSRMYSFQLIEVGYLNSYANRKENKCLMMFSLWIAWCIRDSTERVCQSSFCYKEISIFQDLPDDCELCNFNFTLSSKTRRLEKFLGHIFFHNFMGKVQEFLSFVYSFTCPKYW